MLKTDILINKRMNKAIFLDRDGTLNYDDGITSKTTDFKLFPNVIPGLKLLKDKFLLFVVTNQSGIARGHYSIEDVKRCNESMLKRFEGEDIKIQEVYVCPHHPKENCDCRKPATKFIKLAEEKYDIDLKNSYVIGDKPTDIEMGMKVGCKTIYVLTGHGMNHILELNEKGIKPTLITNNLYDAILWIAQNEV